MERLTSKRAWIGGRRRWVAAVAATGALLLLSVTAVAAMSYNDSISRAQRLNPFGDWSGGNSEATTQVGEPLPCGSMGSTVWYWFDAPGGRMAVDTSGSKYDTVVAVYRAPKNWTSGFSGLTNLACNDDNNFPALTSRVEFDTRRGDKILVQVGGFAGEQGDLKLWMGRP